MKIMNAYDFLTKSPKEALKLKKMQGETYQKDFTAAEGTRKDYWVRINNIIVRLLLLLL